jgi:hypothetical protein
LRERLSIPSADVVNVIPTKQERSITTAKINDKAFFMFFILSKNFHGGNRIPQLYFSIFFINNQHSTHFFSVLPIKC